MGGKAGEIELREEGFGNGNGGNTGDDEDGAILDLRKNFSFIKTSGFVSSCMFVL